MNDFASELKELIDKWRDHPGTDLDDIIAALIDATEELDPSDDDD
jgi:hypothetical protein